MMKRQTFTQFFMCKFAGSIVLFSVSQSYFVLRYLNVSP